MKDLRFTLAVIAVLALGALLFAEHRSSSELRRQIALEKELAQARSKERDIAESDLNDLKRQVASLKAVISQFETRNKEVAATSREEPEAAAEPESAEAKPGDAKEAAGGFAKMMEKMFTDPEMKKMMRSQQTMGINMVYGDLAKELGLSADEAKQVMELLADRQMAITGKSMKLLGGEKADGQSVEEAGQEVAASQEEYNKQLEGLLGKDRYAKFGEYERTMGERMQMTQYKLAFNASGAPLDDNQSKGLFEIMKQERLKQPPSPLEPGSKDVGAAMKAMQSEETSTALFASQEEMNRRVLDRARNVLSPDQMSQFEQIQKQQFEMQKMGMKMGREMFKSSGKNAPLVPPPAVAAPAP